MTTPLIIALCVLAISLIVFYFAYDKHKSYKAKRHIDSVQYLNMVDATQNLKAQEINLQQQGQAIERLMQQNQGIIKDNERWLFEIKESALVIFDERQKMNKLLYGAMSGHIDLEKMNKIYQENQAQLNWIQNYFSTTFKVSPDQYKESKNKITGFSKNSNDKAPWITTHSIN